MRPGTFGYLYLNAYRLTVYCVPCERSVEIDLLKFHPTTNYINKRFWCQCGKLGEPILGAPFQGISDPWALPETVAELKRRESALVERYGIMLKDASASR